MVVDNPEVNDLNLLYPKMLAAGVRFFDRTIKQEEVTISTPLKEAHVKLGPLIILESDAPVNRSTPKRGDER